MALAVLITAIVGYLLGNLNGAILTSRHFSHEDVRAKGSGNAGLTNFVRNFGASKALLVILLDAGKSVAACLLGGALLAPFGYAMVGKVLGALSVSLGHDFPVFFGFKGGKGVLVAATSLLAIDPLSFVCAILVFIAVVYFTKYVSVASIIASISFSVFTLLWQFLRGIDTFAINAAVVHIMATIIVWKHRPNMERIDNGTENKLSFKKK